MNGKIINKGFFGFIARHAGIILVVALLLSAASLLYTWQAMEFLTGRDDLMPKNTQFHKDFRDYRQEFGENEEIVVVMESDDREKTARFGEMLHARLVADRENFTEVFYPYGLQFFRENGLLFMPLEDLQALRENIAKTRPVLKDLADSPSIQTLFTSLTEQIDTYLAQAPHAAASGGQLAGTVFMLEKLGKGFEQFGKGGETAFSLEEFLMPEGPEGEKSTFAEAGKMQILTAMAVRDGKSFVPAEKAIEKIRTVIVELSAMPELKGVTTGLTGSPVLEYEEMSTSRRDISLATIISLVLTVVLLLFAFRGLLNVFAAMVSLLVALALSFGLATLLVGHLNILSMVFAVMLVGIGIEYGIQVVLRYQEEIAGGAAELDALKTGMDRNLRSIVMAAATSACAFLTFVLTDFNGIAELGIIAACGIAVCVLVTYTVLPAMLVLFSRYRKTAGPDAPAVNKSRQAQYPLSETGKWRGVILHLLFGHPKAVIFCTILLCLASIYPLLHVKFDYNLMNLQAKGLQSVEYAYKLMKDKENTGYFAVATASSAEEAAVKSKAFEALPAVDHVVSLNSFIPEDQSRKLEVLAAIRNGMADINPVPYEEDLRVMELPTVFENFRSSVAELAVYLDKEKKPEAGRVNAFLVTLDRFFAGLEKEQDAGALPMLREFQGGMLATLPEKIGQLKASLVTSPVTRADIPAELEKRFVGRTGKYLLQVAPKSDIFDFGPLKRFVDDVRSVDPHATGEPVMVYESMTIMRDAYRGAFLYAFAAIALILLINFRSVRAAMIGLVPLVVGVLLMVSGMWLFGLNFNSANVIVMPLVLGVAVDSGIYIINRFRREGESSVEVVSRSAGRGVIFNTFTIMASFGALMVAHHRGIFSIGAVMSLGMAACQIAFILVLPAVLTLYAARYRKKKRGNDA